MIALRNSSRQPFPISTIHTIKLDLDLFKIPADLNFPAVKNIPPKSQRRFGNLGINTWPCLCSHCWSVLASPSWKHLCSQWWGNSNLVPAKSSEINRLKWQNSGDVIKRVPFGVAQTFALSLSLSLYLSIPI